MLVHEDNRETSSVHKCSQFMANNVGARIAEFNDRTASHPDPSLTGQITTEDKCNTRTQYYNYSRRSAAHKINIKPS